MLVAAPAETPPRDGRALPRAQELPAAPREVAAGADQLGARRDREHERVAVRAVAQRPLAVAAAARAQPAAAVKRTQVAQRLLAHEHDGSAPSPVAAVGSPLRHVRFAAEAHAAVAARARLHLDLRAVVQLVGLLRG